MIVINDTVMQLVIQKKERYKAISELEDIFCKVDDSTGSNNTFSLNEIKRKFPLIAELYFTFGGR